jgi:hypothetical protein
MMEFKKLNIFFNYKTPYPNIKKMMYLINSKSKSSPPTIWNDNIDNEIND